MKLSAPYKGASPKYISQGFKPGAHPALDMFWPGKTYGYGTPLCAPEDCYVMMLRGEKYTPNDTIGLASGYGIWLKGKETGQVHLFWHTLPLFPVLALDNIKRGQIVAYMGNAGMVFSGGVEVPVNERLSTKKGTHLHWEVYEPGYKIGKEKLFVNFTDQVDWNKQPTYSSFDQVKAVGVVVGKYTKLISK